VITFLLKILVRGHSIPFYARPHFFPRGCTLARGGYSVSSPLSSAETPSCTRCRLADGGRVFWCLIKNAKGIYFWAGSYVISGGSRVRSKIAYGLLKARDLRSPEIGPRYDIPWRRPSWVRVPLPALLPNPVIVTIGSTWKRRGLCRRTPNPAYRCAELRINVGEPQSLLLLPPLKEIFKALSYLFLELNL